MDVKEKERGIVFLYDDVDLTDCYFKFGTEVFELIEFDRFVDERSNFHHIEVLYR